MSRSDELKAALASVRARIAAACVAADRDPGDVTLLAVTKTWPAGDVVELLALGVTDVGENRDQEAVEKVAAVHELAADASPRWHFVGQVQRRKARSVAGYADVVHSLDRPELADALGRAATAAGRVLAVLVQVSLEAATDGRGGVAPDGARALADHAAGVSGLRVAGVMAVAPRQGDPAAAFARLREVALDIRAGHPDAGVISAGMSGDLEAAIAHGATLVRVGTALLGTRPLVSEPAR